MLMLEVLSQKLGDPLRVDLGGDAHQSFAGSVSPFIRIGER